MKGIPGYWTVVEEFGSRAGRVASAVRVDGLQVYPMAGRGLDAPPCWCVSVSSTGALLDDIGGGLLSALVEIDQRWPPPSWVKVDEAPLR